MKQKRMLKVLPMMVLVALDGANYVGIFIPMIYNMLKSSNYSDNERF